MAILGVNAQADGTLQCHDGRDWHEGLDEALHLVPHGAPVTVLIHGFRYTWRRDLAPNACPHETLYRDGTVPLARRAKPCRAAWAGALGYTRAGRADGLCIGFAWEARLDRHGATGFAEAYRRAETAGRALGRLVARIAAQRPDLAPGMLSHSLGARVALSAAARVPAVTLGPLVLLGAAEFSGPAWASLETAAAPREVIHVMSRANDVYDALFSMLAPRPRFGAGRSLGVAGLGARVPHWLDLQLDHPAMRAWLTARGIRLARQPERLSHWQFYAEPGAMAFYKRVLRREGGHSLASLRRAGIPETVEPRWARLLPVAPRIDTGIEAAIDSALDQGALDRAPAQAALSQR